MPFFSLVSEEPTSLLFSDCQCEEHVTSRHGDNVYEVCLLRMDVIDCCVWISQGVCDFSPNNYCLGDVCWK